MDARSMVIKLMDEGYSLALIARNAEMSYMDLYRSIRSNRAIKEEEAAAIKRFALVQPCMGR